MKRLVALQELYHNGTKHAGDSFDASDQDAAILVGLGRARAEDVPPPGLQTTALKAEPKAEPKVEPPMTTPAAQPLTQPKPAPKKKTYKRRDMRAER